MKIKSIEGHEVDLKQELIDGLKLRLKGQIIVPGDPAYNESRAVWNGMIDRYPALVIKCLGAADVAACVQFAREHNLLLCIKGGGHNIAGLAVADGGILIDMSLMRGVRVNKKKKVAYTQGGCLLGDVDRETQLHGLATVLGFVSLTGTAGLTLGGGFGYLTRRWGWTVDNVTGMELVTADGRVVYASPDENEDLFWALCGGGGNFGVVTAIDYKLYPVGPEIIGGIVAWPASETDKVLELYRTMAAEAPPELTLVSILRLAPPAPWLPKEWHGKPVVLLLACYSGNLEEGEKIVAPIKQFGNPIADILGKRPYAQMQSLLDTANPNGRRYYWKSEYLASIEPELNSIMIRHAKEMKSPFSALIFFHIGGALNKYSKEHLSVGNRDAKYLFNITAAWEKSEDDEKNIDWARNAWNEMKQFSTGGTYLNFLNQDEGHERTEAALGNAMKRLVEIKKKWDPDNFFRTNRNIKPDMKDVS